jgi:FO synthase
MAWTVVGSADGCSLSWARRLSPGGRTASLPFLPPTTRPVRLAPPGPLAPPNLVAGECALLVRAGIDDWGGVSPLTPDHVNPERPRPQIEELAARSAQAGFALRERLTVYPHHIAAAVP